MERELHNPVPVDEVEAWSRTPATSLLSNPYDEDFRRRCEGRRRMWIPERVWGFKDQGRWVATLASHPKTISVPGPEGRTADLAADAVTGVGVAATHRRQGLLRRMMAASLDATRDRGEPISILIAAEWPIYGRYGYANAVWGADYVYRPKSAGPVADGRPGRMRQVEPAEVLQHGPAIFDAFRRTRAGQVSREGDWWARRLGLGGYQPSTEERSHWFVHDSADGDGADGLLSWKVTRGFDLEGNFGAIAVEDFFAATDTAYRDMAAYLSGIDLVDEIVMDQLAVDESLRWLIDDARAFQQKFVGDFVWVRLIDTAAALAARSYSVPGRLVIDVVDTDGGYGAGTFLLDGSPAGTDCVASTQSPDVRLTQTALASAYLGGQSLFARRIAGGIDEVTPGSLGLLDAMLRTPLAPSNATGF